MTDKTKEQTGDGEAWKILSDDRVKTMMINFGLPNSRNLYHLIMQVQNEIWHLNRCPGWSAQPAPKPKEDAEALEAFNQILRIGGWSVDQMCQNEIETIRSYLAGGKK